MQEPSSTANLPARSSPSHRLTHFSHRYVLPVVGSCAVTLGSLVLLGDWKGTGPAMYWTLLAAGLGALLTSFGYLAWQETVPARKSPSPTGPPAARPLPITPAPLPLPPAPPISPLHTAVHRPHSGLGRAAVSAALRSSEDLWHQWTAPKSRPLGVDLSGPVAEAWYFPARSGAIAPFASRDEDLVFLAPGRRELVLSSPAEATGTPPPAPPVARPAAPTRTQPFTELELEELFPTDAAFDAVAFNTPSPPSAIAPVVSPAGAPPPPPEPTPSAPPVSVPPAPTPPLPPVPPAWELEAAKVAALGESGPYVAGPTGLLPTLDSIDHQVYLEAMNPTPPHLRSGRGATPRKPTPARSRSARRYSHEAVCAMCARKVAGFRSWVDCPQCGQPMCRDCLGIAFLSGADGRCFTCRESHGPAAT